MISKQWVRRASCERGENRVCSREFRILLMVLYGVGVRGHIPGMRAVTAEWKGTFRCV